MGAVILFRRFRRINRIWHTQSHPPKAKGDDPNNPADGLNSCTVITDGGAAYQQNRGCNDNDGCTDAFHCCLVGF